MTCLCHLTGWFNVMLFLARFGQNRRWAVMQALGQFEAIWDALLHKDTKIIKWLSIHSLTQWLTKRHGSCIQQEGFIPAWNLYMTINRQAWNEQGHRRHEGKHGCDKEQCHIVPSIWFTPSLYVTVAHSNSLNGILFSNSSQGVLFMTSVHGIWRQAESRDFRRLRTVGGESMGTQAKDRFPTVLLHSPSVHSRKPVFHRLKDI